MLSEREVISTLNMLRNEHLDVRTVTLGVSLFDCVSHDLELFTANVKAKINRYASQLVRVCNEVGDKYGIPVVNKRISVSPIAVVGAPFGPDGMVRVCKALDEAAKEAGVDFLGGFSALVEKGFAKGDRALIEALPQALAETDRICSSINVASSRSGINMDAVALMGQQILKVADATADRGGLGCAKLVIFANIPQDVPFMAGAYLGVGEPDVVINDAALDETVYEPEAPVLRKGKTMSDEEKEDKALRDRTRNDTYLRRATDVLLGLKALGYGAQP